VDCRRLSHHWCSIKSELMRAWSGHSCPRAPRPARWPRQRRSSAARSSGGAGGGGGGGPPPPPPPPGPPARPAPAPGPRPQPPPHAPSRRPTPPRHPRPRTHPAAHVQLSNMEISKEQQKLFAALKTGNAAMKQMQQEVGSGQAARGGGGGHMLPCLPHAPHEPRQEHSMRAARCARRTLVPVPAHRRAVR